MGRRAPVAWRPSLSADRGQNLTIIRKRSGRFLRTGQPSVHRDFKHAAAGFFQRHRGGLISFEDQIPRRTGAWLIASHAAIFDFHIHVRAPFLFHATAVRRRARGRVTLAWVSTGGTSSGLARAASNASRNVLSLRSFSTFRPNTSFT